MTKAKKQKFDTVSAEEEWEALPKGGYSDSYFSVMIKVSPDLHEGFNEEWEQLKIKLSKSGLSIKDLLKYASTDERRGQSAITEVINRMIGAAIETLHEGKGEEVPEGRH